MNVGPAVSSRLALQRFFARTDFVTSKTSISRRSHPGSAVPFKGSRPDRPVFMLSTLSASQAAKRGAHGNNISLASKCSGCGRPLGQVFSLPNLLAILYKREKPGLRDRHSRGDVLPCAPCAVTINRPDTCSVTSHQKRASRRTTR